MKIDSVVIVGLGQLGRVLAGGFLRSGNPVVPVNRGDDMGAVAAQHPEPKLVLVAVAENDLPATLGALPACWRARIGLIQNELLPRDWLIHEITRPTVLPVWFEKKKGTDAKPLLPTPVFGPATDLVVGALEAIDIPVRTLESEEALLYELVRKNLYILTTNIAGLRTAGTVGQLWTDHRDFATQVAEEVLDIQEWLTGRKSDRAKLMAGLAEAIAADPLHLCTGRSAPARLARALSHGDQAGLALPVLRSIRLS